MLVISEGSWVKKEWFDCLFSIWFKNVFNISYWLFNIFLWWIGNFDVIMRKIFSYFIRKSRVFRRVD